MGVPKKSYCDDSDICNYANIKKTMWGGEFMRQYKIIVEKHPDGYIAYPLGLKGVVVGQGDTYEEALADVKSAIHFHIKSFGEEVLEVEPPVLTLRALPPAAIPLGERTSDINNLIYYRLKGGL